MLTYKNWRKLLLSKNCKDKEFQVCANISLSGDLSDLNNSHIFSLFFVVFYLASLPQNRTKSRLRSKITNVKIRRLSITILEKQQTSKREKWSLKGVWKELAISYYKNAFVTRKHILKVYYTYKQNKEKFNTRNSIPSYSFELFSSPEKVNE